MEEKILVDCRRHWVGMIIPGFFALIFAIGGFGLLFTTGFLDFILSVLIAACIMVPSFIRGKTDYIKLSSTQIVGHVGLIKSKKQVSPISKVQDISVSSGLIGKIFGYSNITVYTAGSSGAEYVYKKMTNGPALQQALVNIESGKFQ